MKLNFVVLPEKFAIVQLPSTEALPDWVSGEFYSITKTSDETSIVCDQTIVPENVKADKDWKALKIQGPLDFSLVGILADISSVLAKGGVSIFVISTYDTDYILVKNKDLENAVNLLKSSGHNVLI